MVTYQSIDSLWLYFLLGTAVAVLCHGRGRAPASRGGVGCPCHSILLFLSFPPFPCLQQPFLVKAVKGPVLGSFPTPPPRSQLLLGTGPQLPEGSWVPGASPTLRGPLVSCFCCESGEQGSAGLRRGKGMCFHHALLSSGDDISIFHNHTHIILYTYIDIYYTC